MRLVARGFAWSLPRERPVVMGILNVTPDSVSDTEHRTTVDEHVAYALGLVEDGADIVDVGGESGRTDAPAISVDEECSRAVPVIGALAARGIAASVDTWRLEVAQAAVAAGAAMINDVSGLADLRMAALAAETGAALVLMHTAAAPKKQHFPDYDDPVQDVLAFLDEAARSVIGLGVAREQIVVDPGLDYAKTPDESLAVLRRLGQVVDLGYPLLLAVSRKYFIGMLGGRAPQDRLAGTLAATDFGVREGAHLVRVHDVADVVEFLDVRAALAQTEAASFKGDADDEGLKWVTRSPRELR